MMGFLFGFSDFCEMAMLAAMHTHKQLSRYWRLDFIVFLLALMLYWVTLSPGVLPADAGEFQLVAAKLGVAHPPGYPLYTMLAWLFTLLTPADPARGVNLFSAVTMALTVMLAG